MRGYSNRQRNGTRRVLALACGAGGSQRRFIADYPRLGVPALEGLETVLTERDADRHLELWRVAVALVFGF